MVLIGSSLPVSGYTLNEHNGAGAARSRDPIHKANQIAAAEVAVSRDDLKKAETDVALQVHNLYFGILIARLQKRAAEQQTAYATERLRETEDDVRNGSALNVAASW